MECRLNFYPKKPQTIKKTAFIYRVPLKRVSENSQKRWKNGLQLWSAVKTCIRKRQKRLKNSLQLWSALKHVSEK